MASRSLGTLTIDMLMRTAGLEQGATKAERQMSRLQTRAVALGTVIGDAIGKAIGKVGEGLYNMTLGVAKNVDELSKFSQQIGISTEGLSRLQYAAGQMANVSEQQFGMALRRMTRRIAEAAEGSGPAAAAIRAIGLEAEALAKMRPDEQFRRLADALKGTENQGSRLRATMAIFDTEGMPLVNMLSAGADEIAKFEEEADKLGVTIGGKLVQDALAFQAELRKLDAVKKGLQNRIAGELLPTLTQMTQRFTDADDAAERLNATSRVAATGVKLMASVGVVVVGVFKTLGQALGGIAASIVQLVQGNWQEALSINREGGADMIANIKGVWSDLKDVWADPVLTPSESKSISDNIAEPVSFAADKVDRAAERIARAQQAMARMLRDWGRELSGSGNRITDSFERRIDQIADAAERFSSVKVPDSEIRAFVEQMTRLAEQIRDKETIEYLRQFDFQTRALTASFTPGATAILEFERAVYDLDKEMQAGIISAEDYRKRLEALEDVRDSAPRGILRDLEMEIEALGKSAHWIARRNALLDAGVTAESEMGKAILETVDLLYEQGEAIRTQIEVMDSFRYEMSNAFSDVITGSKSVKDAFLDMLDSISRRISQIVSDKLVEQLFGSLGTTETGSSGSWLSWIGSLFGGGKASGGIARPNTVYQVNERGLEMATVGGKDYMLTGDQPVRVTPNHQLGGGRAVNVTQNFINPNMIDRNSAAQREQDAAFKLRVATARG